MPSVFFRLSKNAVSLMIAGLIDKAVYVIFFAFIARKLSQFVVLAVKLWH